MRKLGLFAAAAMAAGSLAFVAPASAATIAEFEVDSAASFINFDGATGELTGEGAVNFDWLTLDMAGMDNIDAIFRIDATTFGDTVTFNGFLMQALSGNFEIVTLDDQVLLSGTFNNGILSGAADVGSVLSINNLNFDSDFVNFSTGSEFGLTLNLAGISPAIDVASGSFGDFSATIDGKFTSDGVISAPGIPEPATWAMMIGGFGLLGVSLRRRRALVEA